MAVVPPVMHVLLSNRTLLGLAKLEVSYKRLKGQFGRCYVAGVDHVS
jgi:hypothetical protein